MRKKQAKITCKVLGDTPVIVSFKKKATIKLFVEIQSDKLAIMIKGKSYPVMATGTPFNYTVEMSDIKVAGIYIFDVLLDDIVNNSKMQKDNADALQELFPQESDYTSPVPSKKTSIPDAQIEPKEESKPSNKDNFDEFWN